jgi:hypothetical protein
LLVSRLPCCGSAPNAPSAAEEYDGCVRPTAAPPASSVVGMGVEQRDRSGVLRMAVFGGLAVGAAVAVWRGGHQWWVEWLLWCALGVFTGGLLGSARVVFRRPLKN